MGRGEDGVGNFSQVAGNFTLLLGQVSKAWLVLVENVVLLAVHTREQHRLLFLCRVRVKAFEWVRARKPRDRTSR